MRRGPLFAAILLIAAGPLAAHDLDVEVRLHAPAVVLRAAYSGSAAVAYAAVRVFAPGTATVEFQSGYADAAGRFAFVPDREGDWRAVVDDEMGHRAERRISIGRDFLAGPGAAGRAPSAGPGPDRRGLPQGQGALVGIALIIGLTGFLYGLRSRRRPER